YSLVPDIGELLPYKIAVQSWDLVGRTAFPVGPCKTGKSLCLVIYAITVAVGKIRCDGGYIIIGAGNIAEGTGGPGHNHIAGIISRQIHRLAAPVARAANNYITSLCFEPVDDICPGGNITGAV